MMNHSHNPPFPQCTSLIHLNPPLQMIMAMITMKSRTPPILQDNVISLFLEGNQVSSVSSNPPSSPPPCTPLPTSIPSSSRNPILPVSTIKRSKISLGCPIPSSPIVSLDGHEEQ